MSSSIQRCSFTKTTWRRSGDSLDKELTRTRAKLGETMMKLELAEDLLEKRGYGEELQRLWKPGRG